MGFAHKGCGVRTDTLVRKEHERFGCSVGDAGGDSLNDGRPADALVGMEATFG